MIGYIFETKNLKTGEIFIDKCYSVSFVKNFLGTSDEVIKGIEKYGRNAFEAKMLMPYDTIEQLDAAFESIQKLSKPKKVKEPVVEEPVEEPKVEEPKPVKRGRKKKTEG